MRCPSDETLAAHLAGHQTLGRSDELRSHIDACLSCRALVVAMVRGTAQRDAIATDRTLPGRWPTATPPPIPAAPDYAQLPAVDPAHYVIEQTIARGGMGRIRAARDRRLGRRVAIKELLVDSTALRIRFEREARITARLQHPAIVNVTEAGTWPNGEPFFAMKLVAGKSLDHVIAERASLAERLALLPNVIAAADALAYAHSQHVIHRDLKPQNVLVGDYGETVVIDWGLAKVLDEPDHTDGGDRVGAAPGETGDGTVIGTACYMPPEQARGEKVDQRADVYALGAILFEMLCRERPHAGLSTADVLAKLVAGNTVALDRLPAGTPQDLVAIVAKATTAGAEDRYPSARELAEDLKKFQTGKLVDAYRYTPWQLVRRWIARRRGPVAVVAVLLVALAVTAVVSVNKIVAERDVARTQRAAAEQLVGFVVYELRDRLEPVGRLDLMTGVGNSVRDYYAALPSSTPQALERRARAYYLLGEIETTRGNSEEAKRLFDDGIALAEKLRVGDRERGGRMLGIGLLRRCELVAGVSGTAAARPSCEQAIEHLQSLGAAASYADARALPMAYTQLARMAGHEHRDDALAQYGRARTALETLAAQFSAEPAVQLDLAQTYKHIGYAELTRGKTSVAIDVLARGIALARKLVAADPNDTRATRLLATLLADLGAANAAAQQIEPSLASLHEAQTLLRPLLEREPDDLVLQELAAGVYVRIGQIETPRRPEAALAAQDAARPILERLVKADPKASKWKGALAFAMVSKGHTLVKAQRVEEGRAEYIAADRLLREIIAVSPREGRHRELLLLNAIRLASLDREADPPTARTRLDDAIAAGAELVTQTPGHVRSRELLADAYEMRGTVALALRDRRAARADFEAAAQAFDALERDVPAAAAHHRNRAAAVRARLRKAGG